VAEDPCPLRHAATPFQLRKSFRGNSHGRRTGIETPVPQQLWRTQDHRLFATTHHEQGRRLCRRDSDRASLESISSPPHSRSAALGCELACRLFLEDVDESRGGSKISSAATLRQ